MKKDKRLRFSPLERQFNVDHFALQNINAENQHLLEFRYKLHFYRIKHFFMFAFGAFIKNLLVFSFVLFIFMELTHILRSKKVVPYNEGKPRINKAVRLETRSTDQSRVRLVNLVS